MKDGAKLKILKKTFIFWIPAFFVISALAYFEAGGKLSLENSKPFQGLEYKNEDMGFLLILPQEFKYFQTQRKDGADFSDLEIFVPTSDREYPQEVPGYAKPVVVRVQAEEAFEKTGGKDENDNMLKVVGSKSGRTYAVKFWNKTPADWQGAWNELMKDDILQGFSLE